jgi:hypothetical protein
MDEMAAILILIICGEDSSYRTGGTYLTMTKIYYVHVVVFVGK